MLRLPSLLLACACLISSCGSSNANNAGDDSGTTNMVTFYVRTHQPFLTALKSFDTVSGHFANAFQAVQDHPDNPVDTADLNTFLSRAEATNAESKENFMHSDSLNEECQALQKLGLSCANRTDSLYGQYAKSIAVFGSKDSHKAEHLASIIDADLLRRMEEDYKNGQYGFINLKRNHGIQEFDANMKPVSGQ